MIKAIETRYKGYNFRSRLEARWAVFFDALGIAWEYEPEGFELPDGTRYLPDFKVTVSDGVIDWYEVKAAGNGQDPKMGAFAEARKSELKAANPSIGTRVKHPVFGHGCIVAMEGTGAHFRLQVDFVDVGCKWLVSAYANLRTDDGEVFCVPFGIKTIHSETFTTVRGDPYALLVENNPSCEWDIRRAAEAARSARFEHGQCGSTA